MTKAAAAVAASVTLAAAATPALAAAAAAALAVAAAATPALATAAAAPAWLLLLPWLVLTLLPLLPPTTSEVIQTTKNFQYSFESFLS